MTEFYFQKIFFHRVWPELTGVELTDVSAILENPRQLSEILWHSMLSAIDKYIKRYGLEVNTKEEDINKFRDVVEKMHTINQLNLKEGKWYDCWPVTALEKGPTNCSLGSQVLGRTLQQAGYQIEYGMPGPMSHAVIFIRAKDGRRHYLDSANGVTVEVGEEIEINGIKAYRIETKDIRVPFRLVPVCSLEESTASSIWNLNSLKKATEFDLQDGIEASNAQELMLRFGLDKNIDYGSWARESILPRWGKIETLSVWKEEMKASGKRINRTEVEIN